MIRQTSTAPDDAVIRKLLERRAAAIRAKDVAATLAPCTTDVVNYDLAPPLKYVGAEALDPAGLRGWFDSWKGRTGYDLHDFSVTAGEDLRTATGSFT